MTELEKLLAQRKAINERIRQIHHEGITSWGIAKIDKEHYPTQRPDEWYIAIKTIPINLDRRSQWNSIICGNDRQEVINAIGSVITSLTQLQNILTKEHENEKTEN